LLIGSPLEGEPPDETAMAFGLADFALVFLAAVAALVWVLGLLAANGGAEIILVAAGVATVVHCQSPPAETQA
jgi:hypothetical protein